MRHRRVPLAIAAVASALLLSACDPLGGDGPGHGYYSTPGEHGGEAEGSGASEGSATATATLVDAEGETVGTVEVTEDEAGLIVAVEAEGLDPGSFHGFHVHETGVCQPDSAAAGVPEEIGDFLSAGGHLASEGQTHGAHAGDLPPLLAQEDGTASAELHLDTLTIEDLDDVDGSAFMVHAGPDNFANVPERYAPAGPDEETLSTGDSGDRIACGVMETGAAVDAS